MAGPILAAGQTAYDGTFMLKALELARTAGERGEVPIGAVVMSPEGNVIGVGANMTEQSHSQSRHAEVCALEQAGSERGDWRLTGCTLYVTVQPCVMCLGLIYISRIERLVYGAPSPLFGYMPDVHELPPVYGAHLKGITSGVCAQEAQELLEGFFRSKRE